MNLGKTVCYIELLAAIFGSFALARPIIRWRFPRNILCKVLRGRFWLLRYLAQRRFFCGMQI
jgi:hypothetical protein